MRIFLTERLCLQCFLDRNVIKHYCFFIFRLFEVVETFSKIHLVMEYAKGGELFHKISNDGKMSEAEAKPLFYQVVSAVQHLVS